MGATVLKLGSWNTLTDAMAPHPSCPTGAVLDLNDGQTWTLNDVGQGWGEGLDWGEVRPDVYKAGNVRTVGQRVTRRNYGQNRQVRVNLFLGQLTSYSAYMTALHNLVATLEGISQSQPATLQVQVTGASSPVYLDCVEGHLITQYRELQLLQLLDDGVVVEFEARPFFRGPRQTLQNLVMNPGFEAPFGGGVATTPPTVFADSFANTNAYSVVSGGAPSLSPANTYVDIVHADSPLRHYRLGEASGTSAYDIGGMYNTGTYVASPTLGATGLISGDTDAAATFNGSTQYATIPTTSLPTGNAAWSIEAWAKPSSGTGGGVLCSFGDSGAAGRSVTLAQLSSGGWQVFVWGGTVVSGGTSAAGVIHHIVGTFDGTSLRLYVDGALVAGPTAPGATVNVSGAHAAIGALYNGSYGSFFAGTLDEVCIYGVALSAAQVTAHYNAGHTGATGTVAGAMSIPAAGQVKFGSPAWGAVQTWQVRFRFVTGLTNASFYLHYTDANNYVRAWVNQTTLNLEQCVGGTTHTLITAVTIALTHEAWYWLQITQYPAVSGTLAYVTALLFSDNEGAAGTQIASIAGATSDALTAMTGVASLQTTGGALVIGGNFTNTHALFTFGPGAWSFVSSGTGVASGAWEGTPPSGSAPTSSITNCYPGGPFTSYGCGRIDAAPAGTLNAQWIGATTNTITTVKQTASPVSAAGNVLGVSAWVRSSGVANSCTQSLQINEYDSTGSFLRTNLVSGASVTGAQASWTQLSGTYTTGASCAYVALILSAVDATSASVGGTVWWDNCIIYNQTTTGQTSMGYHELRSGNSPAQIQVSGIQGDVPSPALTQLGVFTVSGGSHTLTLTLAKRATPNGAAQLVSPPAYNASIAQTPGLDSTVFGGYHVANANAAASWSLPGLVWQASQAVSPYTGTFALFLHYKTAVSTPADVQFSSTTEPTSVALVSGSTSADTLLQIINPVNPLSNTSWTHCYLGRLNFYSGGLPAMLDLSQVKFMAGFGGVLFGATTNPSLGSTFSGDDAGSFALAYLDGGALIVSDGLGGAGANSWVWYYANGMGAPLQRAQWGLTWTTLPAPQQMLTPPIAASGSSFTLAPTADPYLFLDPTTRNSAATSINQFTMLVQDTTDGFNQTAVACEFVYTPLYLYPN